MRELDRALGDIRSLRRQVASTTEFRGYGPVALAVTGVLAAVGALLQALCVPEPERQPNAYLLVWVSTAAVCASLAGVTMWTRSRRLHSGLSDAMIGMAVQQFAPALLAGSLLTLVLARYAAGTLWLLPGLWMVVFSLGIFASCRFLPRAIAAAAGWYLLVGLMTVGLGDARALSPWTMGFCFCAGQMLLAGVLWTAGRAAEGEGAMTKRREEQAGDEGRFAYEGLDRVIHERARLGVLTALVTHRKGLSWNELKALCALTDGNLSRHLGILEQDGLLRQEKGESGNRPQTVVKVTAEGRKRYLEYLQTLEQVVKDAAAEARGAKLRTV